MPDENIECTECGSEIWNVGHNQSGDSRISCAYCGEVLMYAWNGGGNSWRQDIESLPEDADE